MEQQSAAVAHLVVVVLIVRHSDGEKEKVETMIVRMKRARKKRARKMKLWEVL